MTCVKGIMGIVKSILITLKASPSASKVEFVSFNSFAFIYLPAGKEVYYLTHVYVYNKFLK